MFTKILVTKAKINIFMYQDTERESYALHCMCCFTTMQKETPAHASTGTIVGIIIKICPIVPYSL